MPPQHHLGGRGRRAATWKTVLVIQLLHDHRTTFVVVSTLEAAPVHEAEFFVDALAERDFHLGALVLNKVLPSYLLDDAAAVAARRLVDDGATSAASLPPELGDEEAVRRVLVEVAESYLRFQLAAQREAEQRAELAVAPEVVATVPYFDTDIYDLAGLLRLGEQVWGGPVAASRKEATR